MDGRASVRQTHAEGPRAAAEAEAQRAGARLRVQH